MKIYFLNLITLMLCVINLQAALPLSEIPEVSESFSSVMFAAVIRPVLDRDLAQGLEGLKKANPESYASYSLVDYEEYLISRTNGLSVSDDPCTDIATLLCNIQTQSGQELKTLVGSFYENTMKKLRIHDSCNQKIGLKVMRFKNVRTTPLPVCKNPDYFPSIILVEAVKMKRNLELFKEFEKLQEEEKAQTLELMKNCKAINLKYTLSSFEDYEKSLRPEEAKKVFSDDVCSYVATVLYHVHKMTHPSQNFTLKVLKDMVRHFNADDSSYDRIVEKNFELQSAEPRV